jgi:hypothetical protein
VSKQGKIVRYSLGLAMAAITTFTVLGLASAAPARAQVTTSNWSYTGTLNAARDGHSAMLLPNGKVLVIGGASPVTAELYDPSAGSWSLISFMPHVHGCVTLLPTGKLLLTGDGSGSAELYDPSTGTFTATGSMTEQAFCGSATLLTTGKVLITTWVPDGPIAVRAGTPELYDPSTGTFSSTGKFVDTGTASVYGDSGLVDAPATLLLNGKVLFAAEPTGQLYDPVSGTFSLTGAMTTPCGYGPSYIVGRTATLLRNGKVLVTGGANQDEECWFFRNAELYDPSTGTFAATSDMSRPRAYHTATLLPDGTVLITGGSTFDCSGAFCFFAGSAASTEIYDPATGTFHLSGNMNTGRESHTATLLNNGNVLVAGGLDYPGYPGGIGSMVKTLASAELYNPGNAPRIIGASVEGKKLIIVGENFDDGAVILLNGEAQITRNDSSNPETALIAKKAGKKIKPGDKVQVRNPNDTISEEFVFARL